jgi:hypothetical protein
VLVSKDETSQVSVGENGVENMLLGYPSQTSCCPDPHPPRTQEDPLGYLKGGVGDPGSGGYWDIDLI